MTTYATQAESSIGQIEEAAERVGMAVDAVLDLEERRPLVKSQAIRRLMGTENPETQKAHSASSAEKVVELDADYAAHREQQRAAEVEKIRAWAALDAAKLRAQLHVHLVGAGV